MRDGAPTTAAIVLAGGSGTRLGRDDGRNKVYLPVGGVPLLAWSLRTLDAAVARTVLVVRAGDERDADAAIRVAAPRRAPTIVTGGPTRSASEAAGVAALRPEIEAGRIDVVLLHDGARPFLRAELVDRLVRAATRSGAAVPGLPPAEGLVAVRPDGAVAAAGTRSLRRVQTPQAFRATTLLTAFAEAERRGIEGADTAELVSSCSNLACTVVDGDPDNIKVTTPADLARAETLAERGGPDAPSGAQVGEQLRDRL